MGADSINHPILRPHRELFGPLTNRRVGVILCWPLPANTPEGRINPDSAVKPAGRKGAFPFRFHVSSSVESRPSSKAGFPRRVYLHCFGCADFVCESPIRDLRKRRYFVWHFTCPQRAWNVSDLSRILGPICRSLSMSSLGKLNVVGRLRKCCRSLVSMSWSKPT